MATFPRIVRAETPDGRASENPRLQAGANVARTANGVAEGVLGAMNAAEIPYCLLNGFRGYPELIASDVDFMVLPKDAKRVAPLLADVARRCDALLVQAIRHETGAWYFVLAQPVNGEVAYLHPDCSTDYRRDGRMWQAAEPVLAKRRRYKTFFVPAIADEFLNYLIKKILKQDVTVEQMHRLGALYLSDPEECSKRLHRFWSAPTVRALVSALVRQEIGWMQSHQPELLSELSEAAPVESWWGRAAQSLQEWRRRLERVLNPTGLSVAICGGTKQQRTELATALEANLRPAFRRTMICAEESAGDGLWGAMPIWRAKVRSTLVIRKNAAAQEQRLVRDEIEFALSDWGRDKVASDRDWDRSGDRCVVLDNNRPLEENLQRATKVALEYLAARLQRRMRLTEMGSKTAGARA